MQFSVKHETNYRYSAPITLGDHSLRLTPRADGLSSLSGEIVIEPTPVWQEDVSDAFGNMVTHLGFAGTTTVLRISTRFEAKVVARDGIGQPLVSLPWQVPDMAAFGGTDQDESVAGFAAAHAAAAGGDADVFLARLTRDLFESSDRHIRPEGDARSAAETLRTRRGACRDLTVLFMAACRSLGMPARFVSGYQAFAETPDGKRHLHAWPEVFLPGIGWRGFDPTHGEAVGDGHLALAAAPEQAGTMPVVGGFWGDTVTSTLDYRLTITAG